MTPSAKDRVRKSRLVKKRDGGKSLTEEERGFLARYEQGQTKRTVAQARAPKSAPGSDAFHANAPAGAHETAPADGRIDPAQFGWVPNVPAAEPGAEPPPAGAPPPPAAGSPVIDVGAPAATPGDPVAAQQFAAFVMWVTGMGVEAVRELLGAELATAPPMLRALLGAPAASDKLVANVGDAANRVAMKYGFTSLPMADEVMVGVALAGSALAIVRNYQRKLGEPDTGSLADGKEAAPASKPEYVETPLDDLWKGKRN